MGLVAAPRAIAALPRRAASGAMVPVSAVASVAPTRDRCQIARDEGQRRAVVQWNVPAGNLTDVVAAARRAIDSAIERAARPA